MTDTNPPADPLLGDDAELIRDTHHFGRFAEGPSFEHVGEAARIVTAAKIRARLDAAYESPYKALKDENRALRLKLKKVKDRVKTHKARVEELEKQLGKGEEEWSIRVFTRADQTHWFHQDARAETFEADLAMTIEVAADGTVMGTGKAPINHGFAVVKRTVWASEWETVKTVEATGEPTTKRDGGSR